jgi:hypothetical protein
MLFRKKSIGIISILAISILFSSCLPSLEQNPTPNLDQVRTEAAQTVIANITSEAAMHPLPMATSTPLPSNTPTSTLINLPTIATSPSDTPQAQVQSTSTRAPTATRKAGSYSPPALDCKLISQQPRDGYKIIADGFFDVTWTVENTGTEAWKDNYIYQYWKGVQFAKIPMYQLGQEVRPGVRHNLVVDFIAPPEIGKYTTWWRLLTDSGTVICSFYFTVVVDAPTSTPTPLQP